MAFRVQSATLFLYANAGLLDDAEQELLAVRRENPESRVVSELLKQLDQHRVEESNIT